MHRAIRIWRHRACRAVVLGAIAALIGPAIGESLLGPDGTAGPLGSRAEAQQRAETSVVIRGNRRIEPETILSYMQLPSDRAITAEDLNAAVRRLFDTGLFSDVRIVPGEDQIAVEVVENPSINRIAFEGNSRLSDEELEQTIQLRPRLPFTASAAEADAQRIIEVYRRIGRYGAEVEPVIIAREENRVDLVFEIVEGPVTPVRSIDFVGNERFSDRRLRRAIETRESGFFSFLLRGDIYDPDRLELDRELLRQFYLNRGYADFTVLSASAELTPDRSGFVITFTVSEGEQYRFGPLDVAVTARGLDAEEFRALLPGDLEGRIYDASRVEEIADELTDLAAQQGFAFVQVRPRARKDAEERTIAITFELIEGSRVFVERIEIEGNTQTLDRVIRREMRLVEGDAFDARKIRESVAAIRGLQYFSRVDIDTEPGSAEDRAVLKVRVQEQSTGSLSFGIGFASAVGPIGNIRLSERNFLGRGQVVNLQATASGDTQIYEFSFFEPRFLDRDLAVGSSVFYRQTDRSSESSLQIDTAGFRPQVSFPLSEDLRIQLFYEFLHDDVDVGPLASAALQPDDGSRFTSSVGYRLTYDQRNDPVEPTKGYLATFQQQIAGLGGESRYVRSTGSVKGWLGFLDDQVISSLEIEGGALVTFGKDSRIHERFLIGGDTFRGFQISGLGPRDLATGDALGGNYFLVSRLEVSFPLGLPEELGIFGGFFVDAGTLWSLDRTSFPGAMIDDGIDLRVAAGPVLFMDTPLGPLELSFGFPIVKQSFDRTELFRLSVGTRF
ncbi:MAG TPA: outer membrane protein assembly factor BamA [Thermohalobaculum sp.]|nr:outer membrane protein assembly factor BamA [Thermohalobaculum sp.]